MPLLILLTTEARQTIKGWLQTRNNIADAFAKNKMNDGLEKFLGIGSVQQEVSQWIIRPKPERDLWSL